MSEFRFIHCSDLHIDSPFKGLARQNPDWAERLRTATLRAFQNIVGRAVRETVDAVVIAGDIFDGAEKNLRAQLDFREELEKLVDAGIPVFVATGNHDALDTWSQSFSWPEGVTLFPGDEVRREPVIRDGRTLAQMCGISFATREVRENLVSRFPKERGEGFAVGVLHANVGNNPEHDPYAPCTLDDLAGLDMDYWALGHIHARTVLRESSPAVVYCGNSQARHVKETGPKGCCLVTLRTGVPPDIKFIATDVIRFAQATLDLSECDTLDAADQTIQEHCAELLEGADGRDLWVRLTLTGRTPLAGELDSSKALADLESRAMEQFETVGPMLGLELRSGLHERYDLDELRKNKDFIGDLIRLYDSMLEEKSLGEAAGWLEPLFVKWKGKSDLTPLEKDDLRELLMQARDQTLDRLWKEG